MAKKVKKVVEEEENLRPEDFPHPPLSKDGKGKGPFENLSPTATIITGMVVIVVGVVLACSPWLFFNGAGVSLYSSTGGIIILMGAFICYSGRAKEKWRKAVKEWLPTYREGKLSDLKLPEWLEIEETKSKIPVLPPDGVIPTSPKLNTSNVTETSYIELPDLSSMESLAAPVAEDIREDFEENPEELFKDEPAPDFDQFWDDSDEYEDYKGKRKEPETPLTFPTSYSPAEEGANLPDISQTPPTASEGTPAVTPHDEDVPSLPASSEISNSDESSNDFASEEGITEDASSDTVASPPTHSAGTPITQRDFLDDFLAESNSQEEPETSAPRDATREVLEATVVDTCSTCGHAKDEHSPTRGTCAACLMSDNDKPVCESYAE